ncbi:TonB-dependent receptor [Flavisolibacter ginsenosidimutans]|uniref:TonB-dependent receptor n=1 Tax=Flavisolibacter ginsenosidimutans TaxID=661481 RepID=A0A5B8UGT0_9BACT|nr:TonB-dependent receptor [Flavisolibacter ginsenosidimutans]QEC55565.1 TonB-dependent receptor [Flavisolibacter ginsenosidimutans]
MKPVSQLPLRTLFFVSFFLASLFSLAQNVTVRGAVKDANGQALSGASVTVQGASKGTVADNSGNYSLSLAPGKYTLVVTYVGYLTQRTDVTVGQSGAVQDFILAGAGELNTVTVVGSRSVARTRTETPVPVDVIPLAQVVNEIGQVDLNQIMNYIAPSFQSARQTIADGTDHLDPAQLRGLGTDQVLVLINGKRRHQAALVNVNGTVNRGQTNTDLSAIPATAIERIEILRDGASAQYGSDAIAGVINIVLKRRTGLLEASSSYGFYDTKYPKNYALYKIQGKSDDPNVRVTDGGTFQGSLGYGFNIGKGYLTLNGEYISREATNRTGTYTGQIFPSVNGQNRDDSIMNGRGINRNTFDIRAGNSQMKGGALFYNFALPVGKNGEVYAFGGYSKKDGNSAGLYRYPSSVVLASNAGKYASNVFAMYPNGFLPNINTKIADFSTAVGYRTKIKGWNFDISNSFGQNTFDFGVSNSVNYSQFAVNSSPQTTFDAGGLKFWQNTSNADVAKRYDVLRGLNVAAGLEYRIDAFGIRSGEEASYKNYDVPSGVGPGAQVFPGFVNTIGDTKTRNAKAVYVDLEQDFTKAFLLTGALRYENYSDFGSTFNYKFSTRVKVVDWFNLRGSVSTGFRAPSMQQKYYAKTNTLFITQGGSLTPVQAGTFTNDSPLAGLLGIPKLKQETSQSYSFGFTAKPFSGFELTFDAYQIDIKNRIILTNNFNGNTSAQIKQILDAQGATTANFFTNAIDTRARGFEAVASYNKTFLKKHSLRTVLALNITDNQVKKDAAGKPIIHASDILVNGGQLGNYFSREDQSRIEVANPKDKLSLSFEYKYSRFGAMLRFVHFGVVQYLDASTTPIANAFDNNTLESLDQDFSAKTVTDLSLSYDVLKSLRLTIGANNLFDVYPDVQTHSSNQSLGRFVYSRRVQQMGFNGAYYFARLKLTLPTGK